MIKIVLNVKLHSLGGQTGGRERDQKGLLQETGDDESRPQTVFGPIVIIVFLLL